MEIPTAQSQMNPVPPITILVVEDEEGILALVTKVLQQHHFKVFPAATIGAAQDVWDMHKEQIDMVLADVQMQEGTDGQELVAQLEAEKPSLKVLFSSGYTPESMFPDSSLLDGYHFLHKPYSPGELVQAVQECLQAEGK